MVISIACYGSLPSRPPSQNKSGIKNRILESTEHLTGFLMDSISYAAAIFECYKQFWDTFMIHWNAKHVTTFVASQVLSGHALAPAFTLAWFPKVGKQYEVNAAAAIKCTALVCVIIGFRFEKCGRSNFVRAVSETKPQ